MNIVLARIDDRLIHGQVATVWSKVTGCTYITTRGAGEEYTTCTTDTHIPVPFTFFIPRNSCTERINPVVRYDTAETPDLATTNRDRRINGYIQHIGFTKTVLIAETNATTQVRTNGAGLCCGVCYAGNCHNGNK